MYVIKKMRLNKFENRPIVTARQLYLANGACPATIVSKETSDCYNEPSIIGASKTKVLGLAQQIIAKSDEFKKNPDSTKPLQPINAKDQ